MIYLTNDINDQGVYFDMRKDEPLRMGRGREVVCRGVLGNGISEVTVTVRSWRDCLEMVFSAGRLFDFVDERTVRQMLGNLVREMTLH